MKYVLKITSRYIKNDWRTKMTGVPRHKMYFLQDEKSIVSFFKAQMKKDLLNPIGGVTCGKKVISLTETLGIYSYLVNAKLDLQYLCYGPRVNHYLRDNINKTDWWWAKIQMLRSLPFNYTLYSLMDDETGAQVLNRINWNTFFKTNLKSSVYTKEDIKYVAD